MTKLQVGVMMDATAAFPSWFRARRNGERVVLANLYRLGYLERRVRREGKCSADNAYEYRPVAEFIAEATKKGLK